MKGEDHIAAAVAGGDNDSNYNEDTAPPESECHEYGKCSGMPEKPEKPRAVAPPIFAYPSEHEGTVAVPFAGR